MKVDIKTLGGLALNYAVAKTVGFLEENTPNRLSGNQALMWFINNNPNYTTNWDLTGEIMFNEGIGVNKYSALAKKDSNTAWFSTVSQNGTEYLAEGNTPLIAVLRCYLSCKVGQEIDIPEALIDIE